MSAKPSLFFENVIQPRTGSSKGKKSNQATWKESDYTLGYAGDGNCSDTQWEFLGLNKNQWCINPVPKICSQLYWDGMEYDSSRWKDMGLDETLVPEETKFSKKCNTTYNGNEATNRSSFCPLHCAFDSEKFTTLEHVEAYEKKFGKYKRNVNNDISPTTNNDYTNAPVSTGVVNQDADFSDGYTKIMQNFCSQKATTNCSIDPYTNKQAPKCSYLKSMGPEGDKCRFWLDSHGPYKFSQMTSIGDKYCKGENADSYDCRCIKRDDDPTFAAFQKSINSTGKEGSSTNPGCYFLPCADPTNYIVGNDIMGSFDIGGEGKQMDHQSYGVHCGENLCLSVTTIDGSDMASIEGNKLYIQCGKGIGTDFEMLKNHPGLFTAIIIAGVSFMIFILVLIWYLISSPKSQKKQVISFKFQQPKIPQTQTQTQTQKM